MGFTYLCCASGIGLGGMMVFIALAPYYFQNVHGFSSTQFALIAAFNAVPLSLASGANFLFIHKFGSARLMQVGIAACVISGLMLLFLPIDTQMHGYSLILPFAVFMFGQFLVQLNTLSYAYNFITDENLKDNAASVQYFIYLVIAAITGQIASLFVAGTAKIFGIIFIIISVMLFILTSLSKMPKKE